MELMAITVTNTAEISLNAEELRGVLLFLGGLFPHQKGFWMKDVIQGVLRILNFYRCVIMTALCKYLTSFKDV